MARSPRSGGGRPGFLTLGALPEGPSAGAVGLRAPGGAEDERPARRGRGGEAAGAARAWPRGETMLDVAGAGSWPLGAPGQTARAFPRRTSLRGAVCVRARRSAAVGWGRWRRDAELRVFISVWPSAPRGAAPGGCGGLWAGRKGLIPTRGGDGSQVQISSTRLWLGGAPDPMLGGRGCVRRWKLLVLLKFSLFSTLRKERALGFPTCVQVAVLSLEIHVNLEKQR